MSRSCACRRYDGQEVERGSPRARDPCTNALQGADVGDTTTIIETAIAAAEQVEDAQANVDDRQSLEEIVGGPLPSTGSRGLNSPASAVL